MTEGVEAEGLVIRFRPVLFPSTSEIDVRVLGEQDGLMVVDETVARVVGRVEVIDETEVNRRRDLLRMFLEDPNLVRVEAQGFASEYLRLIGPEFNRALAQGMNVGRGSNWDVDIRATNFEVSNPSFQVDRIQRWRLFTGPGDQAGGRVIVGCQMAHAHWEATGRHRVTGIEVRSHSTTSARSALANVRRMARKESKV